MLRSEDDGPNSEESGDEGAEMPGERADRQMTPCLCQASNPGDL